GTKKINPTTVALTLDNGRHILVDFYGENIFRLFVDSVSKFMRDPEAQPPAQILVSQPRKAVPAITLADSNGAILISTQKISIHFNRKTSEFKLVNLQTGATVAQSTGPIRFEDKKTILALKEQPTEYFYGGGVQNGRFSHKGKTIAIENQSSWTDGGVASPNPFYWSTGGYGIMWYTFKKGKYDFGAAEKEKVMLYHETDY